MEIVDYEVVEARIPESKDSGERQIVPSGKYSPNKFPVGCIVSLAILENDVVLVPNSGKMM